MKTSSLFIISFLSLFIAEAYGQQYKWETLPSPPAAVRYDDMVFVTPEIGWAIHPYNVPYGTDTTTVQGRIYKTIDGGRSWKIQLDSSHRYLRCICFADSLHGWAGQIGVTKYDYSAGTYKLYDTTLLYKTTNGGNSWETSFDSIIGIKPPGLCGMRAIDSNTVYAVGRWSGPAYFMKTTDGGKIWKSIDMNNLAGWLVDCHFWTADSGIVVGATKDSLSGALILFTSDGGEHWTKRYEGKPSGEGCWKITFPSINVGYVSVQGSRGYLLKTMDKGITWEEVYVSSSFLQGVGFINDTVGWTGGWNSKGYATTNGGKTWKTGAIGKNINRFHFFGDSIGYCSGQSIFKMTKAPSSEVSETEATLPSTQNYPNPFTDETSIHFSIATTEQVMITIYDALGKEIATILNEKKQPGEYSISIAQYLSAPKVFPSGTYYYVLKAGKTQLQRKMIRL